MSTFHDVIRWARAAPIVYRPDGRPDTTVHHVLVVLATYADKNGRARPSLTTLADACTLTKQVTKNALKRLVAAGLLKDDGEYGSTGTTMWVLVLGLTRGDVDEAVLQGRRETARLRHADRQKRYRDKNRVTPSESVTRDALAEQHVTPRETVTFGPVTPSEASRDAMEDHHVTPSEPSRDASMTVTSPGQEPRSTNELPLNYQRTNTDSPTSRRAKPAIYTAVFEAFWNAYGKKGAKGAAARQWQQAVKRTDRDVIMAAVGPYVASTPEIRYRKDAERWLRDDCWESVTVSAASPNNGHQTYRNPDIADGDYLKGWTR